MNLRDKLKAIEKPKSPPESAGKAVHGLLPRAGNARVIRISRRV